MLLSDVSVCFFDFDGLLVDTEPFHYNAYKEVFKDVGLEFSMDFLTYLGHAHHPEGSQFHKLYETAPISWSVLRAKKEKVYQRMLQEDPISLMPGILEVLEYCKEHQIEMCVVTNSEKACTDRIRKKIPALNIIPLWITREDYKESKPAPDGYLKALSCFPNVERKNTRGFEDSLKGVVSLNRADIPAILISRKDHPQLVHPFDAVHIHDASLLLIH